MYAVAADRQHLAFIQFLESTIADYTHRRIDLAGIAKLERKGWTAFVKPTRTRGLRGVESEYLDGFDGAYLFQSFLRDLLDRVRFEASVAAVRPPRDAKFWTAFQLADHLHCSHRTIENYVSKYRADHGGELPPWAARHLPWSEHGFLIRRVTWQEYEDGGMSPPFARRQSRR